MRVLIVDDQEDSRDLTEGTLLSGGYDDVVTACSGWEALRLLDIGRRTEEPPAVDMVLLDIVMPEMDGVEVCARIRKYLLVILALLVWAPGLAAKPLVVLVSIDGFRPDYLKRGNSPTLDGLVDSGASAKALISAFPSVTFPNHYSMVTGLFPDHHGIVNNTMTDPVLGKFSLGNREAVSNGQWWAQGTPLWETAQQHGMKTATMFWPGSEADIHGAHPNFWKPYDGKITPLPVL